MYFPFRDVSPLPTVGWANRQAAAVRETIGYFRKNDVRVVSMSWGYGPESIERAIAQHRSGRNAAKRTELARRIFGTVRGAFLEAIADAPEILFVSAVGNSPGEPVANDDIPSSFELPNMISVGAVDAAGEATAFTSSGKVDLYANGYEVESVLPGGDRQKWSGTSMASPQVVNLAAKILAVCPALTTARLRDLIIGGCDEKILTGNRPIKLLNPKRSFELAQEKFSGDPTPTPSPEG
jgi:subtilisin family serine protease